MKDIHAIIQDRFYLSIKVLFRKIKIYSLAEPREENRKRRIKEKEEKD